MNPPTCCTDKSINRRPMGDVNTKEYIISNTSILLCIFLIIYNSTNTYNNMDIMARMILTRSWLKFTDKQLN